MGSGGGGASCFYYRGDRVDYALDVRVRDFRRKRQADCLPADSHCGGIVFRLPAKLSLIHRMFGNAEVMNSDADATRRHQFEKFVATDLADTLVDQNRVKMMCVTRVSLGRGRQRDRQACECFVVSIPNFSTAQPIALTRRN